MAKQLHKVEFVEKELVELQSRLEASLPFLEGLKDIQAGFQELNEHYLVLKTLIEQAKVELRDFDRDKKSILDQLSSERAFYRNNFGELKQETAQQLQQQRDEAEVQYGAIKEQLKRYLAAHKQILNGLQTEVRGNVGTMDAKVNTLVEEAGNQMKQHKVLFKNLESGLKEAIEHKLRAFGILFISANILAVIALAASLFAVFGQ